MEEQKELLGEELQGSATLIDSTTTGKKRLYLESYGCAMNFSDSEIVASILSKEGYTTTQAIEEADLVLLNTCSIRDKAEQTVRNRLQQFNTKKKEKPEMVIGILGCMAERLKSKLLEEEKLVDIVAGPDAYRDLPGLIEEVGDGRKAVNVLLSREETYADISPVRLDKNGVTSFISIMRGCDNMCSFCVVPFTRGRERSRDPRSIVKEAQELFDKGYRELTLLGQNVDSYKWNITKKGEVKNTEDETVNFAQLLEKVAQVNPKLRIRFSTSHPKDMTDDVLITMSKYQNICKYIHLPVQSGNTEVLNRMNRGYTREWYLNRIAAIRKYMPECGISTDVITGFCGETQEQHQETISLMKEVAYDFAYMYKYSERPRTLAERKFEDDVPEEEKQKRLAEIVGLQMSHSHMANKKAIGKTFEVLIEKQAKKSKDHWSGRNSQNAMVVFPKTSAGPGEYVQVKILDCTAATLIGEVI